VNHIDRQQVDNAQLTHVIGLTLFSKPRLCGDLLPDSKHAGPNVTAR
jgi:hypothetical protein